MWNAEDDQEAAALGFIVKRNRKHPIIEAFIGSAIFPNDESAARWVRSMAKAENLPPYADGVQILCQRALMETMRFTGNLDDLLREAEAALSQAAEQIECNCTDPCEGTCTWAEIQIALSHIGSYRRENA